jgi:hypothetical protein
LRCEQIIHVAELRLHSRALLLPLATVLKRVLKVARRLIQLT